VADLTRIYAGEQPDPAILRQAAELGALSEAWRNFLRDRLARIEG
jgi:hypothetical protein